MAEAPGETAQDKEGVNAKPAKAAGGTKSLGIRLLPMENSDQPVGANCWSITVGAGLLAALPRVARAGGKLPEHLNGKLAVRVTLGYDALANVHQQLGQGLRGLSAGAKQSA